MSMNLNENNIDQKRVETLKQWFDNYTSPFISGIAENDRNIILKREHTQRVCGEILLIADKLGLNGMEKAFCEMTALLHDIGRFEQYRKFGTFVDGDSVDHAELGYEIIGKEHCLDMLAPYDRELIKKVVRYHNRAALPEDETETCLFYARLLRDADKLDIWYLITSYYRERGENPNKALDLGLPDTPGISDKVHASLMNRTIVYKEHLQNLNDFKMLQMGWVFDLNYKPSFNRLAEKGYLGMIRDVLPRDREIDRVYEHILDYIDEKAF